MITKVVRGTIPGSIHTDYPCSFCHAARIHQSYDIKSATGALNPAARVVIIQFVQEDTK
jgi:hypothetical protein